MSAEVGAVKYKVELDDSNLDKEASKTESKVSSVLGKAAGGIGKAAVAGISVGVTAVAGLTKAMTDAAKQTAAYGDTVDKMSQKIGISAEAYQEWDYVLGQNGADIGILETGMKTLASAVADAGNGTASAQKKFEQLGLSFEDLGKLSQEDMFSAVIAQLQQMPEGAERTALAADLLGKSAMELGPLLNQTAEDTQALKDQAHDLGMIMSDESVKASAGYTDAMDNLDKAFQGMKNGLADDFLPALTEVTNGLANLVAGNEGATEQITEGFEAIVTGITDSLPTIIDTIASLAESLAAVAPELLQALANGLLSAIPDLLPTVTDLILELANMLIEMAPELLKVGLEVILQLALGIGEALPELIPAAIDAILEIVEALIDNIDLLVDAAIAIVIGLAEGLINALPKLIEKAPEIIEKLVMALIRNAPKLASAALQVIVELAKAIVLNLPKIVQAAYQIITSLIKGIGEMISKLPETGKKIIDTLWNGIKSLDPLQWGSDLIQSFVDGIMSGIGAVGDAIGKVADKVRAFLHFSVPDEGPLADFDSYGPDLVDTFAKGIEDNAHKAADAAEGLAGDIAMGFNSDINYNVPDIAGYAKDLSASITGTGSTRIEVPVMIDGREVARASAWYMGEQLAWEAR
jgi:hypothetical protein